MNRVSIRLVIRQSVAGFTDYGHTQKQYVVGDAHYLSAPPLQSVVPSLQIFELRGM